MLLTASAKNLSIGTYPTNGLLLEVRTARDEAKRMIADGTDPTAVKKQTKEERKGGLAGYIAAIAHCRHSDNPYRWKANHATRIWHTAASQNLQNIADSCLHTLSYGFLWFFKRFANSLNEISEPSLPCSDKLPKSRPAGVTTCSGL